MNLSLPGLKHLINALIELESVNALTVVRVAMLSYKIERPGDCFVLLLLKIPVLVPSRLEHFLDALQDSHLFKHAVHCRVIYVWVLALLVDHLS